MSKTGWYRFAIVGFIWGVPYLFLKVAVEEISPAVVVLGRVGIGAAILLPIALRRKVFLSHVSTGHLFFSTQLLN